MSDAIPHAVGLAAAPHGLWIPTLQRRQHEREVEEALQVRIEAGLRRGETGARRPPRILPDRARAPRATGLPWSTRGPAVRQQSVLQPASGLAAQQSRHGAAGDRRLSVLLREKYRVTARGRRIYAHILHWRATGRWD